MRNTFAEDKKGSKVDRAPCSKGALNSETK